MSSRLTELQNFSYLKNINKEATVPSISLDIEIANVKQQANSVTGNGVYAISLFKNASFRGYVLI